MQGDDELQSLFGWIVKTKNAVSVLVAFIGVKKKRINGWSLLFLLHHMITLKFYRYSLKYLNTEYLIENLNKIEHF